MKRTFSLGGGAEPECWTAQRQSIESFAWIDGQFADRHLGVWFLLGGRRIGHQMTLLLHWDGTSWKTAPSPDPTKGTFVSDLSVCRNCSVIGQRLDFRGLFNC